MFGIPDYYAVGAQIDIKEITKNGLKKEDKKRLKKSLEQIVLQYQISGEEIPSLINDDYNCQAILFFDIRLKILKDCYFVGDVIQRLGKPLTVLRFMDTKGQAVLSLAPKRLNRQDEEQTVIEEMLYSLPYSLNGLDESGKLINTYLDYSQLLNLSNKMEQYYELFTRLKLITHRNLWSGMPSVLNSKIYYDLDKMKRLNQLIDDLDKLKTEHNKAVSLAEKAVYNGKIKKELKSLHELIN